MRYEGMSPAEVYDRGVVTGVFGEWTPALVALAAPQAGERVLDLACGSGSVTREVASTLGVGASIRAVDLSGPMLEVARARGVDDGAVVEWHEAPADALPFGNDEFDLALCQQGLQFFPDKPAAAAELARVLRPGGRLALSVWSGLEANPLQQAYNESLLAHVGAAIFTAPFSYGDPATLGALLRDAGFVDVVVETETRTAHFESVEDFAAVHVIGAAAVIADLAALDADQRAQVIEDSARDVAPIAARYVDGGQLAFPMQSLVATARVPASPDVTPG